MANYKFTPGDTVTIKGEQGHHIIDRVNYLHYQTEKFTYHTDKYKHIKEADLTLVPNQTIWRSNLDEAIRKIQEAEDNLVKLTGEYNVLREKYLRTLK